MPDDCEELNKICDMFYIHDVQVWLPTGFF